MRCQECELTRIKVSGVVRPEDAEVAARLGIDFVACMFYAGSPRYVTIEQACALRRVLGSVVRLVGVFVDTPTPIVQRVADHCRLDHIQLFGSESRATIESLRPHAFKAVTVASVDEAEHAVRAHPPRRGSSPTDPALLLHLADAVADPWRLIPPSGRRAPVLIAASAIGPDTVAGLVADVHPWGVDVWDAVETRPGEIDHDRLRALVAAVRDAERASAPPSDAAHA
jgi:phosphoribosylanthranilate isomerase